MKQRKRTKKKKESKQSINNLWYNFKYPNIHVLSCKEVGQKQKKKKKFENNRGKFSEPRNSTKNKHKQYEENCIKL